MTKPKSRNGIEITYRVLTDGSIHWTIWSTSGKVLENGTKNNKRLAKKAAEHAERMIVEERGKGG